MVVVLQCEAQGGREVVSLPRGEPASVVMSCLLHTVAAVVVRKQPDG